MDEEQVYRDVRKGDLRIGKRQIPFLVLDVGNTNSTILLDGERIEVGTVSLSHHSWLVDKDARGK
jgi:hypothetical protein